MLSKLRRRLTYANVTSTLALFLVVAGGTAWAAHETILSSDIVDNEVRTADVRNDTLSGGGLGSIDIANGEMTTNEIRDDSQAFGGLFAQDLAAGSVRSSEVQDNSLTGADIDESSLLVSRRIARPTGGTLGAGGLTTSSTTPYPLGSATFTQRADEFVEFVGELKTTLARPSGSTNTGCSVRINVELDGRLLMAFHGGGGFTDELETTTLARRDNFVLPSTTGSVEHTVTANAQLVETGFPTNACSTDSQIDSFALNVIGTR